MAKTYATIEGCRSPKTCTGGNDGVLASAQSYDGSVIVKNYYDEDTLKVRVGTNNGSSCYTDYHSDDFCGTFEEFKALLKLAKDIKEGRASVVHHRKAKN